MQGCGLCHDAQIPRTSDSRSEIAPNALQSLKTAVQMRAPYAHLDERPLEKQEQVPKLIRVRLVHTAGEFGQFALKSRELFFGNKLQQRRLLVGEVVLSSGISCWPFELSALPSTYRSDR